MAGCGRASRRLKSMEIARPVRRRRAHSVTDGCWLLDVRCWPLTPALSPSDGEREKPRRAPSGPPAPPDTLRIPCGLVDWCLASVPLAATAPRASGSRAKTPRRERIPRKGLCAPWTPEPKKENTLRSLFNGSGAGFTRPLSLEQSLTTGSGGYLPPPGSSNC